MNDFLATVLSVCAVAVAFAVVLFLFAALREVIKPAEPSICSCPSGKLQMHTDFAGDRVVYRFECDEK